MIEGVDRSFVVWLDATALRKPARPLSPVGWPAMIPPEPASILLPEDTLDTRLVRLGRPSSENCAPPTTAELTIAPNCTERSEKVSTDISKITASTSTWDGRRSR